MPTEDIFMDEIKIDKEPDFKIELDVDFEKETIATVEYNNNYWRIK